jgi:hypothetical protein
MARDRLKCPCSARMRAMVSVGKGSSKMPALFENTPAGGRLGGPEAVELALSASVEAPNAVPVGFAVAVAVAVADAGTDAGTGSDTASAAGPDTDAGTDTASGTAAGTASDTVSRRGSSWVAFSAHFAKPRTLFRRPSGGWPPLAWFLIE